PLGREAELREPDRRQAHGRHSDGRQLDAGDLPRRHECLEQRRHLRRAPRLTSTHRIFERNCFVRSSLGSRKKCSGGPSSISRPSSIITTRSAAIFAKPISCVTTIIVIPSWAS